MRNLRCSAPSQSRSAGATSRSPPLGPPRGRRLLAVRAQPRRQPAGPVRPACSRPVWSRPERDRRHREPSTPRRPTPGPPPREPPNPGPSKPRPSNPQLPNPRPPNHPPSTRDRPGQRGRGEGCPVHRTPTRPPGLSMGRRPPGTPRAEAGWTDRLPYRHRRCRSRAEPPGERNRVVAATTRRSPQALAARRPEVGTPASRARRRAHGPGGLPCPSPDRIASGPYVWNRPGRRRRLIWSARPIRPVEWQ
jgi:hypothetical protein